MAVKLNKKALEHARKLIRDGKVVEDKRDDWSEAAPSTEEQNAFLEKHGWDEYALWHLGVDEEKSENTKGRFSFPYGDFRKVRRGGVNRSRVARRRMTTTTSRRRRRSCSS